MPAHLVPVDDGRPIVLDGTRLTVGRRLSCDVVLEVLGISGRHAELELLDGDWFITDCGSTNGTFVNGTRCESTAKLAPNDVIRFGKADFRFEFDTEATVKIDRTFVLDDVDDSKFAAMVESLGKKSPAVPPIPAVPPPVASEPEVHTATEPLLDIPEDVQLTGEPDIRPMLRSDVRDDDEEEDSLPYKLAGQQPAPSKPAKPMKSKAPSVAASVAASPPGDAPVPKRKRRKLPPPEEEFDDLPEESFDDDEAASGPAREHRVRPLVRRGETPPCFIREADAPSPIPKEGGTARAPGEPAEKLNASYVSVGIASVLLVGLLTLMASGLGSMMTPSSGAAVTSLDDPNFDPLAPPGSPPADGPPGDKPPGDKPPRDPGPTPPTTPGGTADPMPAPPTVVDIGTRPQPPTEIVRTTGQPVRVDLATTDLGQFLSKQNLPDGAHVIASGTGPRPCSPFQIDGRSLKLEFTASGPVPPILVPVVGSSDSTLMTVRNGSLELVNATIVFDPGTAANAGAFPARYVQVVNGNLGLRRCRLLGPNALVGPSAAHRGLVEWTRTGRPDESAGPYDQFGLFEDTYLSGAGTLVRLDGRRRALFLRNVIGTSAENLLEIAIRGSGPKMSACLDISRCTLAARRTVLTVTAAPLGRTAELPLRVFVDRTAFAAPMAGPGGAPHSLVLECPGAALDEKQILWDGSSNAFSETFKSFVRPTYTTENGQNFGNAWIKRWGTERIRGSVHGPNVVTMRQTLRIDASPVPENFMLRPDSRAAKLDGGRPVGADPARIVTGGAN